MTLSIEDMRRKTNYLRIVQLIAMVGILSGLGFSPRVHALPAAVENNAFSKARGKYYGVFDSAQVGRNPAETKLPKAKGMARVNKLLPQVGDPPAKHIEKYKITRAVVRQGGGKVFMKGRLVESVINGGGKLIVNVNLKGAKPKLVNSKTAGTGVFFGNGKLTGKKQ